MKTGFLHAFLIIFLMVTVACDFDIPEKFEMPTWYLDLKIPLVQTRYEMSDISDSTNGIFLTDDSLGFKIVQEGSMPATELPDLPAVPLGLDQAISSGEIAGINMDIELPAIVISQIIDVVLYDASIYQDTAKWCDSVTIPIAEPPFSMDTLICIIDTTTGDTLGRLFSFPNDSIRHMSADNYNSLIVALFDSVMNILSTALDTTIDLGLSSIALPDDPAIIASIDTLIIATHETNSVYRTLFKNNGLPTNLQNVFSNMATGNNPLLLTDTLANHNTMPTISSGETYADTTNLSGLGLTSFLNMATNMSLTPATGVVTIPAGSLYVDFQLTFQMGGIDSIDVTTHNYSMSDGIDMPAMELPEMDMSESGISKMEIYRNVLKNQGADYNENKLIISNLASSFPFDMNFLLNFQNFSPIPGSDSVKIDTVLKKGVEINKTFDMRGYSLQSTDGDLDGDGWPDSAFTSFDLVLDITIPEQNATIPLDGSPLGEFTLNMELEQLSFSSIGANLYMEMPAEPTEQEFPAGFTGAIPTEAVFEIIFKNQIRLPIEMIMEFKGYNSLGELTYVPVIIDTVGFPLTDSDLDTAMTIIALSKLGTTITIYESVHDSLPSYSVTNTPCDTCSSIIDLLASNPVSLIITPEVKVDGRGSIEANKAIAGGFRVTIPFVLQLEPMTFMGGSATEISEFDHDTRYKIRNSLIQTELVSNITNALPFGAEISVLMSNDSLFPTDTTATQLGIFRDSLAARGLMTLTDSLYIVRRCTDLSPDSGEIYIFNVMTDYSECIDSLPYIVKYNGSGTDTVISYVDTLFKFLLPNPESYYGANDTTGYPEGMVAVPGSGIYESTIDTSQIFLLTDFGSHYTMPRFHLPGTDSVGVFISVEDYLEISSFITFRLSSSGAFAAVNNELVLTWPNGGQTLYTNESYDILWKSYGLSDDESVDLYYSTSGDTNTYKPGYCVLTTNWTLIDSDIDNSGSYNWDLSSSGLLDTDSLRLKIISADGKSCDINGHYLKIRNPGRSNQYLKQKTKVSWDLR
ncbi:MAG: hypothetical protein HOI55_09455 [Candidatus Marinimicrobia bacterium]|nr:hypothetical protein [Candidatus Neomarinimicrobiota bacterium]